MTKQQISWQSIKPQLKNHTHTELLRVVSDLYALNNDNKHFLHARYQDSKDQLTAYKAIIRKALYPAIDRNQNLELSVGRKAIRDYKKAVGDLKNTLDLMVYYIECGNDFTLAYGDISGAFYDSLVSMFSDAPILFAAPSSRRS